MNEHIILIKGASSPRTQEKTRQERHFARACAENLQAVGYRVTRVGTAWRGYYDRHLYETFLKAPDAHTILVNMHGNIQAGKHHIAKRHEQSSVVLAEDFYQTLAVASGGRPLNVFMFSCGSGNSCFDAIKLLPTGSTLVNVTLEDQLSSYVPDPSFLRLPSDPSKSLAEHLFLNLLSQGYPLFESAFFTHFPEIQPQVSVSTQKPHIGNTWNLWEIARRETEGHEGFSATFCAGVTEFLDPYFSKAKIAAALRTLEHYQKTHQHSYDEAHFLRSEGSPVPIRMEIDEPTFLKQVWKADLFGALCAIGYYANRSQIGAFKAGHPPADPLTAADVRAQDSDRMIGTSGKLAALFARRDLCP